MMSAANATRFNRMRTCRTSFFQMAARITGGCFPSHAQRALCFLSGGVGTDWRADDRRAARVDGYRVAVEHHRPVVETAGRGPGLLLAHPVVLRAVARA